MLLTLLIFLPVITCMFWMLINTLMASRTDYFKPVLLVLLGSGMYLFTDSCYDDMRSSYSLLASSGLAAQFFAPCMIPLVIRYLRRMVFKNYTPDYMDSLWLLVPTVTLTGGALLYALCGQGEIIAFTERLYNEGSSVAASYKGSLIYYYYLWTNILFRVVIGVQILILLLNIVHIVKHLQPRFSDFILFLKGQGSIRVAALQVYNTITILVILFPKMLIMRDTLQHMPWLPALLGLVITYEVSKFAFFALFSSKEKINVEEIKYAFRYNYRSDRKAEAVETMMGQLVDEAEDEALQRIRMKLGTTEIPETWDELENKEETNPEDVHKTVENIFNAMSSSWDENSLLSRFQKLMVEEQMFLQPKLSIGEIAERLHTNKTYISKLVNNTYNLGFPELVNTLRVDYAEQYILNHRDAKQDKIAEECGFLSASSFNIMFKKITGMTPKVWIATIDKQKKAERK